MKLYVFDICYGKCLVVNAATEEDAFNKAVEETVKLGFNPSAIHLEDIVDTGEQAAFLFVYDCWDETVSYELLEGKTGYDTGR